MNFDDIIIFIEIIYFAHFISELIIVGVIIYSIKFRLKCALVNTIFYCLFTCEKNILERYYLSRLLSIGGRYFDNFDIIFIQHNKKGLKKLYRRAKGLCCVEKNGGYFGHNQFAKK